MFLKKLFYPRAYKYVDRAYPSGYVKLDITRKSKRLEVLHYNSVQSDTIVILCHPYKILAKDYFLDNGHVAFYQGLGYEVVIFDFNGFGKSDDIDLDLHKDLLRVSETLHKLYPRKGIISHGLSMGAAMTINACQRSDHKIDAIIIENCLDTNYSYLLKRNYTLYRLLKLIDFVIPSINRHNAYYKEVATIKNVEKALLIYNEEDELATPDMGQLLNKNISVPAELHILMGEHLEAITSDAEKYQQIITDFYSR